MVDARSRLGPYEIVAPIGAGGMGEVYRARDTRLGRDVAIKVLPAAFASDPERLRRFEQEARAVAALSHPNVLALYDVGTFEGSPFIVSELLEGETLRERLESGGLTVRKAVEIAVQIAQGLAVAHEKGIIHRDLKPGNVFITGDGHVKILDFGLAKLTRPDPAPKATTPTPEPSTETGALMGTVGYMSPEQVRGLAVDHRTDIFSFGCVLYEMLSGRSPFRRDSAAETTTAILHEDPAPLAGAGKGVPPAIEGIVTRCLEKRPEDRFTSARDLGFALQAVAESEPREAARRTEEPRPYPGLAAFTEADTGHFFGREAEIAALWRKIPERSLLGLIGPSGAGKTSFLRAGMIAHAPPGWRCLVATPGQAPFAALARALAPAFAGDPDGVQRLLDFHVPDVALGLIGQWRRRVDHGLLVIDQFEELFTLNTEDVQRHFGELLGRIAALDGLHVMLSMRDDFLFGCHAHRALAGVFDGITPLGVPSREGLRRAVVEPAAKLGFAFEDDGLVDEMLDALEGERATLPLLAFAVAGLWDERDLEKKLLTREAYARIGGVAGALAQHAEATLERIGAERLSFVREIFRNLVTAQVTRAALEVEELVSVFAEDQRTDARHVLSQLVDARLLTSFEIEAPDGSYGHRVEIVHESLLSAWPRLVRWRTEDEGGAQLRDQLRRASHLWEEKGKPDDLLWTGTSYQEYQVWRARYSGGLSEAEESFGRAMAAQSERRRRRKRAAYSIVLVAVLLVAGGLGMMWRKSARETHRAEAEAAQREAAQVLALGRLRLADHPNAALAYAIASLERADNGPARRFAVEALWQGPPALFLMDPINPPSIRWSLDGRWLALGGNSGLALLERGTRGRRQLSSTRDIPVGFTSDARRLVTDASPGAPTILHVWSLPEGRLERTLEHAEESIAVLGDDRLLTFALDGRAPVGGRPLIVRCLALDGTAQEVLGRWDDRGRKGVWDVDPSGSWIVSTQGGRVLQHRLGALSAAGRVLGVHAAASGAHVRPWRDRAITGDASGGVRIWDVPSARLERTLKSTGDARSIAVDPRGRYLAAGPAGAMPPRSLFLFDLAAPRSAEPVPLLAPEEAWLHQMSFSPDGSWLGASAGAGVILWNLAGARSTVLGRQKPPLVNVTFAGEGHLLSASREGVLRYWPLSPTAVDAAREIWSQPGLRMILGVDRRGRFAAVERQLSNEIALVTFDGTPPKIHKLQQPEGAHINNTGIGSLDPSGRFLAVSVYSGDHPELNALRIVDLTTGNERTLDTHPKGNGGCEVGGSDGYGAAVPAWLPDGRLISDGDAGLRVWDSAAGASRLLRPCKKAPLSNINLLVSPDSRLVLRLDWADDPGSVSSLSVFDLVTQATREITSHGNQLESFALDARGTILVTGDKYGVVRVGPITGEEPHLLFGHAGTVYSVTVSPDGRTIASGSDDGTIRLWRMPDLSKPPLHTLPHDELVAKLRSLTNLRAVRDPSSDTGWKIEIGPFPGWAKVPEWQP